MLKLANQYGGHELIAEPQIQRSLIWCFQIDSMEHALSAWVPQRKYPIFDHKVPFIRMTEKHRFQFFLYPSSNVDFHRAS